MFSSKQYVQYAYSRCRLFFFLSCHITFLLLSGVPVNADKSTDERVTLPGRALAVADFNYDRASDLLIQIDEQTAQVYFAIPNRAKYSPTEQPGSKEKPWTVSVDDSSRLISAAVSDIDGDSFADVLVNSQALKQDSDDPFAVTTFVIWGSVHGLGKGSQNSTRVGRFKDQPALYDCNLDGLVDVLGLSVENSTWTCHLGSVNRNLDTNVSHIISGPIGSLIPYPPLFTDLSGQLSSQVLLAKESGSDGIFAGFDIFRPTSTGPWEKVRTTLSPFHEASSEKLLDITESGRKDLYVGFPTTDDFNADGIMDVLVPVVHKNDPGGLHMFIYSNDAWHGVYVSLAHDYQQTLVDGQRAAGSKFSVPLVTDSNFHFRARSGDFDRDGFPDLLLVVGNGTGDKNALGNAVLLLRNVPCAGTEAGACGNFSRSFRPGITPIFDFGPTGVLVDASFVDVKEDGNLDLLYVTTRRESKKSKYSSIWSTEISIQVDAGDTCFMLVQGFTPTCYKRCQNGRSDGSGIAYPGGCFLYSGTNPSGSKRRGSGCLRSQTSHTPLNQPSLMFGLGRMPNFVEHVSFGLPVDPGKENQNLYHTWNQLIPNSRIYIIPYPRNKPSSWVSRLFVTPSRLILLSFASLACICGVILMIIIVLHVREKRFDAKERENASQRAFYFSAL